MATPPFTSTAVAAKFQSYPPHARPALLALRALVFRMARNTPGVGTLDETLKWGEPAYLTKNRAGTTIRIDWKCKVPSRVSLYFHCQTSLVASFRSLFPNDFVFEGNRAIHVGLETPLPMDALAVCIEAALTYHLAKRAGPMAVWKMPPRRAARSGSTVPHAGVAPGQDGMTIAAATADDAAGIAHVHVQSWQAAYAGILDPTFLDRLCVDDRARRWQDTMARRESETLVARCGGEVQGFVSFAHCRDEGAERHQGEVWALYAKPQAWGRGIGRALLARALGALRAAGRPDVSLWVLSKNHRAIAFYRSFGFEAVAGSAKQFELGGRQVDEICMRLRQVAS